MKHITRIWALLQITGCVFALFVFSFMWWWELTK
jgi:hypothetical protein